MQICLGAWQTLEENGRSDLRALRGMHKRQILWKITKDYLVCQLKLGHLIVLSVYFYNAILKNFIKFSNKVHESI